MTHAPPASTDSASPALKPGHVPERKSQAFDELDARLRARDDFTSAYLSASHNPLLAAASRLLSSLARLKPHETPEQLTQLRTRLCKRVTQFAGYALQAGIDPKTVKVASRVLCSMADEIIMTSPWGSESEWATATLLHHFHDDASGGVRFFQWLEHYMRLAPSHVELLELMYVCMALGYEGRYASIEEGDKALLQLRHELFDCIRRQRGEVTRAISRVPLPQKQEQRRQVLLIPAWLPAMLALFCLGLVYSGFAWMLDQEREKALIPFQQFDGLPAAPGIV